LGAGRAEAQQAAAAITTVLLAANATVTPPGQTPALYLTGLGLLMFLAGFVFSLILFSFLGNVDTERS
jgi:hypothetical protein